MRRFVLTGWLALGASLFSFSCSSTPPSALRKETQERVSFQLVSAERVTDPADLGEWLPGGPRDIWDMKFTLQNTSDAPLACYGIAGPSETPAQVGARGFVAATAVRSGGVVQPLDYVYLGTRLFDRVAIDVLVWNPKVLRTQNQRRSNHNSRRDCDSAANLH